MTSNRDLRALQRVMTTVTDTQLLRVVAMVDALPKRAEADALLAQVRPRLAGLRPKRAMNFGRLLFRPFDPVIVSGPDWRRGTPSIPRTALTPLSQAVHDAVAPLGSPIDISLRGLQSDDVAAIGEIGRDLWPRAAVALAQALPSQDWQDITGLTLADYTNLTSVTCAVLGQASALHDAWRADSVSDPALEAILTAVAPAGPLALEMTIVILLARLRNPEQILRIADDMAAARADIAGKAIADRAVDFVLDGIESHVLPTRDPAAAAIQLRHHLCILNDLELRSNHRPSRRARIEAIRRSVDTSCRTRFTQEIDAVLQIASENRTVCADVNVTNLEQSARNLRRFEFAARQLGGSDHYDRDLRRIAEAFGSGESETRVDRLRLVEILLGPEAAQAIVRA